MVETNNEMIRKRRDRLIACDKKLHVMNTALDDPQEPQRFLKEIIILITTTTTTAITTITTTITSQPLQQHSLRMVYDLSEKKRRKNINSEFEELKNIHPDSSKTSTRSSGLFCARNINPPETFDSHKIMNPSVPNPPETVDSLHKYETETGQAQKFLDRVGQNFGWPASMEDCVRATVLFYLADESALEFDDEAALNLIFFYDDLDKGTFDEHKDDWVLVRIQVRRLRTTNSVIFEYNFHDPFEGWRNFRVNANGYGYPARVFYVSSTFEVAIGDNNGWSKWTLAWILNNETVEKEDNEISVESQFSLGEFEEISKNLLSDPMENQWEIFFTLKIHLFLKG
ncbi:hypothetical protein Glove_43g64 [Diversispora epigaea]|uniref:BHLH domain-containing protein n=1 Tax=Diversispora epigaea TaxID=1348612 RepID=A0A397JLM1_9GLOM|nr:hypothetical protein Glove_43g64 [Diversispora epigaea]